MTQKQETPGVVGETVELAETPFRSERGPHHRCPWCINYYNQRLVRHMTDSCPSAPCEKKAERKKEAEAWMAKYKVATMKYPGNMWFNPAQMTQATYTKEEVCYLLECYGHAAVPLNVQQSATIRPYMMDHVEPQFKEAAALARNEMLQKVPAQIAAPEPRIHAAIRDVVKRTATRASPAVGGLDPLPFVEDCGTQRRDRDSGETRMSAVVGQVQPTEEEASTRAVSDNQSVEKKSQVTNVPTKTQHVDGNDNNRNTGSIEICVPECINTVVINRNGKKVSITL